MTDLDRYLTDEMIEQGREALTFGIMGCGQCCGDNPPDELDHLDFDVARAHVAARAAIEAAAPLVAAQALEELRDYLAEDRRVWHGVHGVRVMTDTSDPRTMIPLGEFLSARAAELREAGR